MNDIGLNMHKRKVSKETDTRVGFPWMLFCCDLFFKGL